MTYKVLDLFAGAGGLSTGFGRAGFEIALATDIWKEAATTYQFNHSETPFILDDIHDLEPDLLLETAQVEHFDVIIGGPPCQGFSTLGKRDVEDPRNRLFREFIRLVKDIRPKVVVIENVAGLLIMDNGRVRENIEKSLHSIGYQVTSEQLLSANYGVPQLRRRAFFVGVRNDLDIRFSFPAPTHGEDMVDYLTVWDAIGDLPELSAGEIKKKYESQTFTEYQRQRRKNCKHLQNHQAANHCPRLVKTISFVPDGGNRQSIPPEYQPKSGFHNSYSRLASFKPAVAVTSNLRKPSSARAIHPFQNRGLTVREGARLQSFDDDYIFCCSRTSQYLQVGNAVPPLLAQVVAQEIFNAVERATPLRQKKPAEREILLV
jgi:DNA (cytosine-5)-methyltransferase 1